MSSYESDRRDKMRISKKEAIDVFDNLCRDRDFWLYDMEANRSLLQAALDVLHNNMPGNHYTVRYKDSQNCSRLMIYCHPCAKELMSLDPFKSHDEGKSHKKCVMQIISKKELERTIQHGFERKPFNSPKGLFEPGTLEHKIDYCKERVLGMQFIYKEKLKNSDTFSFTCQLCRLEKVSSDAMFRHLTHSTSHNRKYLRVKFDLSPTTTISYETTCREIEEREGKINCLIVDFTKQNKILAKMNREPSPPVEPPSVFDIPAARSPRRSVSPPPLVSDAQAQTDTAELDAKLPLKKELMLIKTNEGHKSLARDKEALELMLETLRVLNVKMHKFYDSHPNTRSLTHKTAKYQSNLAGAHAALSDIFPGEE